MWSDNRADLLAAGAEEFGRWIAQKPHKAYTDLQVPSSEDGVCSDGLSEVVRSDATLGELSALRLTLREEKDLDNGSERWSTTAYWIRGPNSGHVWVDLEHVSDDIYQQRHDRRPPGLIGRLLELDGSQLGEHPLRTTPKPVAAADVPALIDWITTPTRAVPIVLFSVDQSLSPEQYSARARETAKRLAGCADVRMLLAPSEPAVNDILTPLGLEVHSGAARIYLPGVDLDKVQPWRHRYVRSARLSEQAHSAARQVSEIFIDRAIARRPPKPYRGDLKRALDSSAFDDTDWQEEAFRLDEEVASLRQEIAARTDSEEDAWVEAAESEALASKQTRRLEILRSNSRAAGEAPELIEADFDPAEIEFLQCSDAVKAGAKLQGLQVHPNAAQDLERIDERANGSLAAERIYKHLVALSAYSQSGGAGFYTWCETSGDHRALAPKQISMSESETVSANPKYRNARVFDISKQVEPAGSLYMEAHTKPVIGGGMQVPRIYFQDDTKGRTGLVHIGFIGPHDLVPNTQSD